VKESAQSQNSGGAQTTSVERNIPQNNAGAAEGKQSADESKKSEELTNFELSSKTVTTVSGGYNIEHLSVAVLLNRSAFAEPNKEPPKPEAVDRQIKEIEQLVSSAAGLKKERSDTLKVTAVDFMFNEHEMSPVDSPGLVATLGSHLGAILNALTAIAIAALGVIFGLAPIRNALLVEPAPERREPPPLIEADQQLALGSQLNDAVAPPLLAGAGQGLLGNVVDNAKESARARLEQLIERDDAQAAAIMKQWMQS
jgi:flagellar M-ring protein FliF